MSRRLQQLCRRRQEQRGNSFSIWRQRSLKLSRTRPAEAAEAAAAAGPLAGAGAGRAFSRGGRGGRIRQFADFASVDDGRLSERD